MRTGEGKTLVSTAPAYLNALAGKGVHIVTVNDYLAKRDAEWMGRVHEFLGLTVGVVLNSMNNDERKKAYACDITYVTNNELGFDYLRDNMAIYKEQMVLRDLDYAIIDAQNDGLTAQVTAEVTTCDWNSIIKAYQEDMAAYTATSQALADGMSVRLTKANQMLLDCIDANDSATSSTVTLTLENDGTNWKLKSDDVFVEAILGNIKEAVANTSTPPET